MIQQSWPPILGPAVLLESYTHTRSIPVSDGLQPCRCAPLLYCKYEVVHYVMWVDVRQALKSIQPAHDES